MINITLKQLRYFDALAQHGHFGRAAAVCSISQPALSLQIKEMEETLGQPLFERTARQVRLTPFGEDLLTRARSIIDSVDALGDFARQAAGQSLTRLRLGIIPTIAPYLLPRLMNEMLAQHAGLDLHVRETLTPTLIRELAEGRLDAAILALPVSESAFQEVELFDEDFVLVRPAMDANQPVPNGEDLKKMRLLLLEEGHCFRDQALSFCHAPKGLPQDGLDGSSLTTLVQMVGAGMGVTLIPEMAVSVEVRSNEVSVARFPVPRPKRSIGMIWRKTSPLADQLFQISEIVKKVAVNEGKNYVR